MFVAGGIGAAVVAPALASSSSATPSATPSHSNPAHHGMRGFRPAWSGAAAGFGMARQLAAETAKETGISRTTLLSDLRSGQTLDQVAGAKAQSVVTAVLAKVQTRLDAAVKAGRLTSGQESTDLTNYRLAANEVMNLDLAPFLNLTNRA
ncbi:MAG: hypothetical protein JOZ92_09045 [Candidatus Dormibacteraeota bacterium]|nr:hypothetical protein [Candidatus Dormibacteraeota bacterium]